MRTTTLFSILLVITSAATADSRPKKKAPATTADVERLEAKVEEQQKQIDKLVRVQQQYLQALRAMFEGTAQAVKDEPKPVEPEPPKPVDKAAVGFTDAKPAPKPKLEPRPAKPKPAGAGSVVGKITGVSDAVVYVEDISETARGTATMKQEGKQFTPRVLVVQKGTSVAFPNMDAIFHNVFSVTPDYSFDLGSYQQGESKSVTMSKSGVLSVYCNMHPNMVGNILVVPNRYYARAGKDGFFRITGVPAGKHRIVAWAPNSKPVSAEAEVTDEGVATLELELKKGRAAQHSKKDGLPYGSYAD